VFETFGLSCRKLIAIPVFPTRMQTLKIPNHAFRARESRDSDERQGCGVGVQAILNGRS